MGLRYTLEMYRIAFIGLCLIFAGLQYRLWIADGGYSEIHRLQNEISEVREQNQTFATRNNNLEAEISDLKEGSAAMEGRARADLGMVRKDEDFYLVVEPQE